MTTLRMRENQISGAKLLRAGLAYVCLDDQPPECQLMSGVNLKHWRKEVGNDLYPVLRLLLPQVRALEYWYSKLASYDVRVYKKDRERAVYGLKEKNLAKTYIKLIPLGMKDPDSIRLLNWKRPTEKNVSILGLSFEKIHYELNIKPDRKLRETSQRCSLKSLANAHPLSKEACLSTMSTTSLMRSAKTWESSE